MTEFFLLFLYVCGFSLIGGPGESLMIVESHLASFCCLAGDWQGPIVSAEVCLVPVSGTSSTKRKYVCQVSTNLSYACINKQSCVW